MKTTNFKKTLCMLLVLTLSFSLFGCKKDEPIDPTETTSVIETTDVVDESMEATIENTESTVSATEETEPDETVLPTAPSHVHQWIDSVTEPTCTEGGYTTHICECGEKEVDSYTEANGHTWSSWKTVTEATETSTGKAEKTCYVCEKVESRVLSKLPASHKHSYTSSITTEPTCTKFGVETFVCDCGDTYTEDVAKLDHDYDSEIVEATCKLRGYTLHTCSVCGNTHKDNYTSVAEHTYKEDVTDPTCTERGYTTYTCKHCRDSYVDDYVKATGHSWGKWTTTKEATETSTGTKERSCKNCTEKETKTIDKLAHTHNYTSKVTTEATCEKNGVKTFTCSCNDSYTENIPSTGHAWSKWTVTKEATETSTGTKERSCSTCKETETKTIAKLEHTHSYNSVVTKPTCTKDGYTTYTCKTCSHSYTGDTVSKTGHSWGDWVTVEAPTTTSTGKAESTCSSCGTTKSKTLDKLPETHTHKYSEVVEKVDATCSEDGYVTKSCSCGDVKTTTISATGHNWESYHTDEVGHEEVYIVCHCGWRCAAEGNYVAKFGKHVDSVDPDTRYDHSYYSDSDWVVDTPAKDWQECSKCGKTK